MAKRFDKSVASSGLAQLRQFLLYKGRLCGRVVELVESKNTAKTCSNCDALTGPSGLSHLSVRHWVCTRCGASHDRDMNAAINRLKAGVRYTFEKKVGKNKIKLTQLKKTRQAPAA
ncbi:MAG: zinc ribbon domain-containing protein [Bdellovibrionia bacterium]